MKKMKKKKDLTEMNDSEKEEFLSLDFIERMIRVEQRVAETFGEVIPYKKTSYFKNLPAKEKTLFDKFLDSKQKKKGILTLIFIGALSLFVLFQSSITGNVIESSTGGAIKAGLLGNTVAIFILLFSFGILMGILSNKRRLNRLEKHFKVLDEVFDKKQTIQHLKD